jgi:CheY-like chemotaxis protein
VGENAARIDDAAPVRSSARLRLLVADDDLPLRKVLCRALRRHHDVEEASDGSEVLSRVRVDARFDAILLDLEMPIMNGRRALAALSAVAPALASRTLIVTGGASTPELQRWLGALPPGRVHGKPIHMDSLMAAIEGLAQPR